MPAQGQNPKDQTEMFFNGFFRAEVIEVDIDGNQYGAVRVLIPDLSVDGVDKQYGDSKNGLIAYPANNPIGGMNSANDTSHYQQSVYVPAKGSWVWIFFERGNPSKPFYFAAFNFRHTPLPPENLGVAEPHKVITLVKSNQGRSVIVCDSADQQRVEISGKRRNMGSGPSGSSGVYDHDGNMNSILLDERDGQEKLLIRTRKGDYIHLDIDERQIQIYCKNDIRIQTEGHCHIQAGKGIQISSKEDMQLSSDQNTHIVSKDDTYINQTGGNCHILSGGENNIDGSHTWIQTGKAQAGTQAAPVAPQGERST